MAQGVRLAPISPAGRALPLLRSIAFVLCVLPTPTLSLLLASKSAEKAKVYVDGRGAVRAGWQRPIGWFAGFAEGESTFNEDGVGESSENPERNVAQGLDPVNSFEKPSSKSYAEPWEWFHESESAGRYEAWQSHYPALTDGIAGNRVPPNPWRHTPGTWDPQGWVQDYQVAGTVQSVGREPPQWFDSDALQYDGFGRPMMPLDKSGRRYFAPWVERGVNTSLVCPSPGCNSSSYLQVYDPKVEVAQNCKLNVLFHPTDFDEDWSNEVVEFVSGNGKLINRGCAPKSRGCNMTSWEHQFPCVNNMDIDHLINSNGGITVSAGITNMVDECPYNGNLMSAVVQVACMVVDIQNSLVQTTVPPTQLYPDIEANTTLKCATAGCGNQNVLIIDPRYALQGGTCFMNVSFMPTDYDQENTAVEKIEYLAMNGVNLSTDITPGYNPCLEAMTGAGPPDAPARRQRYSAILNRDVTKEVIAAPTAGVMQLSAKNSHMVDECDWNGNLLDGFINIRCKAPANLTGQR